MSLDPSRCALIIQDLQNDVISEGGAFAASGAPAHARSQRVVENVQRLAEVALRVGLIDGTLQGAVLADHFTADVDIRVGAAEGVRGDEDALY